MKVYLILWVCVQSLTSPLNETCVQDVLLQEFTNVQSCDTVANFNADQGASVTLAQNTTDNLEGTGAVDITAGG